MNINIDKLGEIMKIRKLIFERVLSIILILMLIARVFSYNNDIYKYEGLDSSPYSLAITLITLLAIWFQFTATLTIACRSFFNIKSIKFIKPYFPTINAFGKYLSPIGVDVLFTTFPL